MAIRMFRNWDKLLQVLFVRNEFYHGAVQFDYDYFYEEEQTVRLLMTGDNYAPHHVHDEVFN